MPRADDPTVSLEHARELVEAHFADLRPARLEHFGRGWDHEVYLVDGAWVFRFPRNDFAARALEAEIALLPWLAARLPLPIAVPSRVGALGPPTGWRFAGHRCLPGATICDAGLDDDARARLAPALAAFVRALHDVPLGEAPAAPPLDPIGRFDLDRRRPIADGCLTSLAARGVIAPELADRLREALAAASPPAAAPLVFVHADLHARNLLAAEGALSGVIDWVDLHAGHPAADLVTAFEVLPLRARDAFFAVYGEIDATTRALALARAIDHTAGALAGAIERGDERFARESRRALLGLVP